MRFKFLFCRGFRCLASATVRPISDTHGAYVGLAVSVLMGCISQPRRLVLCALLLWGSPQLSSWCGVLQGRSPGPVTADQITASDFHDVAGVFNLHRRQVRLRLSRSPLTRACFVGSDYGRFVHRVRFLDVSDVSTVSTSSSGPITAQIQLPLPALLMIQASNLKLFVLQLVKFLVQYRVLIRCANGDDTLS